MATRAAAWTLRRSARRAAITSSRIPLAPTRRWYRPPLQNSFAQQWMPSLLGDPLWLIPKKGSGFDNFIPKNKKDKKDGESSSEEQKKQDDSWSRFGSGGGGGGGGGGNNNNNNNNNTNALFATLALMTFLAAMAHAMNGFTPPEDDEHQQHALQSREITWPQLADLIDRRQVEKLVVTKDGAWARVYLRPGAPPASSRPTPRAYHDDHHDDDDPNRMADMQSDLVEGLEDTASYGSSSQQRYPMKHQYVYRIAIGSIDSLERKLQELQLSMGREDRDQVPVQYAPDSTLGSELLGILPYLVLYGAIFFAMRQASGGVSGAGGGGGIFQVGKSTAKKIEKQDISIGFGDVAGCQEAKKEIMEFVDFLQDPSRFTKLGAKIPKGALLCGPPGTGKTLLAKAVAGESGVPFYSISGSDFIEMFVGVGPSRVRDLFKEARENAPCIVFIDEIDAVGRKRGRGNMGGNDERENTLNQLLVEMDGFNPSTGVVVLAGTNRVDILDEALTRPGRFDRQIQVDKPDLQGRKEVFLVHLKGITLEEDAEEIAGRLAGLTPGFAGADIANICNEAAIVAARRKGDAVTMNDFEKATDRIVGGLESNKIMSKEERSIVAHHEAGHAVAGWFLEHADPLLKVTIIPRSSGALGYAQYLPKEVFLRTQEQIMDIVSMALAGRAAEEIFFGRVTTGASDDLRRVTDLVYSTIQIYGMNNRLGQLAFPKDPNAMFEDRPYSDATAKAMDEEAKLIVDAAYKRTLDLLLEKKEQVKMVADLLLEKETITHDDLVELVGERPFKGDPAYEEFVRKVKKVHKEEDSATADEQDEKKEGEDPAVILNPAS